MRTIAIDGVGIDLAGGGRTSVLNLLLNMFALDPKSRYLVLLSKDEPALRVFPNVDQFTMPISNRFAVRLYLQFRLRSLVLREGVDLVHFAKNLGTFALPCPYVVTVHDLTTLLHKELQKPADVLYWRLIEPLTVRRAAQVVAVSHDAARDVERFYRVPKQSIEVIHWAPHERFVPVRDQQQIEDLRRRYGLLRPFVLFLGILAKKKNLPTLLRAVAHLHSRGPDAPDLVVVGRGYPQSGDTESVPLVSELGLGDAVHFVGAVPDEELPLFYSASQAYVLPSLHEGFGIPCLEAMACGTPVITTHGGALPEVAGDAAVLVNEPLDHLELSEALERVVYDQDLRQDLITRGFRRASEFSWEDSARKMLSVYESVLEDS